MKATAKQIGNSQKERIEVDGRVHLKSVNIGRWNYIVLLRYYNDFTDMWSDWFEGHSATREAAEKWQPFPMTTEIDLCEPRRHPRDDDDYWAVQLERHECRKRQAKKLHAMGIGEYARTRSGRWQRGGLPVYRVKHRVERKVLKIERADTTEY